MKPLSSFVRPFRSVLERLQGKLECKTQYEMKDRLGLGSLSHHTAMIIFFIEDEIKKAQQ